ncbi:uncharacterized protein PITG_19133 [Phytophthora infestans T30-4]|uniref:Uncharacterized protein n=1 Tax=Phytophthora infestans (strain T30-4) TaxID=403677 RepID=D0NYX1_PHYIT|nr:uncharacterized protein PITG_19133 [Phytophthora infestans T30-4]EEY68754.1 hypothetical protein PITG_19133 [Phytophthora infestans T30-4]|eukprot:XP_002997446.1 hypothetical protein PITG_19133 [Phytophthora infestans T30-4]
MNTCVTVSCDEPSDAQKKKFLKTLKVSFTTSQAAQAGKGVSIVFSPGEIAASLNTLLRAWPWLKENIWPVIKPFVSGAVDTGAQALGAYTWHPALVNAARSPEMKAKMAKLRFMRKSGGSFKL